MKKLLHVFNLRIFSLSIILFLLCQCFMFSQVGNIISDVKVSDVREGEPVNFNILLLQPANVSKIIIAYKTFGMNEFLTQELQVTGSNVLFTLSSEQVTSPYLEYYIIATLTNGTTETFPIDYSITSVPAKVMIIGSSPKDKEVLILSPELNTKVPIDELIISISLIKAPESVNKSSTKIFINNKDVTDLAVFADDLILVVPSNFSIELPSGANNVRIQLYDNKGELYHTLVQKIEVAAPSSSDYESPAFLYGVNVRGESRNEVMRNESEWYNNVGVDFNGIYKDWNVVAKIYATSEEKAHLQPNNRYSLTLFSDWLYLGLGDVFPNFPQLILNGKRVRGVNGSLNLGFFNLNVAAGEVNRSIDGSKIRDAQADEFASNIVTIDNQRIVANLGTYKRNLLSIRPSFKTGESVEWGLSFLRSVDDKESIKYGARPKENVVFGTDLKLSFDNRNIILAAQTALSLNNNDISYGTLTDSQLDSLSKKVNIDAKLLTNLKSYLGDLITVNQFLVPFNPQELASFAGDATLSLNYFDNSFKGGYVYRGNDFQSFGQSLIRTDVAGFSVSDVIRLIDNKLFVSLAYEDLNDNLQKTKVGTTNYKTLNTSFAFYPRMDFPNIVISFSNMKNKNDIDVNSPDSLGVYFIDDMTNRYSVQLSYNLNFKVKHRTSLFFALSDRQDNGIAKNNAENTSLNLSASSYWTSDFMSSVSLGMNNSKTTMMEYNFISINLNAQYLMMHDKLKLSATINPLFGDLKRILFDVSSNYKIMDNFSAGLVLRYFINDNMDNDSIFGINFAYDFLRN